MKSFLLLIIILALTGSALRADTFITDVGTGGFLSPYGGEEYDTVKGYELQIGSTPIEITALGTFDNGSSTGLSSNALVGVWSSTGTLLTSVVVAANSGTDGDFSYASLTTPLTLQANTDYYFGSRSDADGYFNAVTLQHTSGFVSSSVATYISYNNKSLDNGSPAGDFASQVPTEELGDPTQAALVGPNFQYQQSSVPEPNVCSLLGLGLAFFIGRAWLRTKRVQA